MPKLTKRVVDGSEATEREVFVWDTELRGFGLRVYPNGLKVYLVQYRMAASGRQRRHKLGAHGVLTPEQARTMAREVLAKVANGIDPSGDRAAAKSSPIVSELLNRYLTDHAEPRLRPKTLTEFRRIIEKHIRPQLGKTKVSDVTRSDIAKFHLSMRERPGSANQALSILSKVFNLAEEWDLRPLNSNPALKQNKYPSEARDRFLSADEVGRLGRALIDAETIGLPWRVNEDQSTAKHLASPERRFTPVDPIAIRVIFVLLLTGARLSEITELEWAHVDFEQEMIALPRQKGKPRKFYPASTAAMAVLARLDRVAGSSWVFPRASDSSRSISNFVLQNVWERVHFHAGIENVRLHDLRHTAATWAARTGANSFAIRDVMRHANVQMTDRYVNADLEPVRELHNTVGKALSAALEGRKADVVSIMDKRRRET